MANTKITDLSTITGSTLASGDKFVVVDVSDTSMASSGTTKAITASELLFFGSASGFVSTTDFTTTSLTAVDVTGLSFSVAANHIWTAEFKLYGNSSDATGGKFAIDVPAGATVEGHIIGNTSGGTAFTTERVTTDAALTTTAFWASSSTELSAILHVTVIVGATAGTVKFQAAKVTSGTLTLRVGSSVTATRIA